jgi:isopentenyl phosphate kinase
MSIVLVKVGGAFLTKKSDFETLDLDHLNQFCSTFSSLMKDPLNKFVLIHGAGSFGHFQASEYGIPAYPVDLLNLSVNVLGFSKCRLSVQKLNAHVLDHLHKFGIPAVNVDLWPGDQSDVQWDGIVEKIFGCLEIGLIPVIHGDAILVNHRLCVLSGDVVVVELAKRMNPKHCCFVTNVEGVYESLESRKIVMEMEQDTNVHIQEEKVSADVTGGMKGKLKAAFEAAEFTEKGFVYIVGASGDVDQQGLKLCLAGLELPFLRNYGTIIRKKK